MSRPRLLCSISIVAVLCACGDLRTSAQKVPAEARRYDGKQRILYVQGEDREMNAAIARARATVHAFLPRLEHPPRGQSYMGVKVRLGRGEVGEHIWLYGLRLEDGRIVGRLMDDAERFPGPKAGDVVRVAPAEITDWMTVENGRACGGFTSRIIIASMNAAERAVWLRQMGIERMPPGGAVCDEEAGARP